MRVSLGVGVPRSEEETDPRPSNGRIIPPWRTLLRDARRGGRGRSSRLGGEEGGIGIERLVGVGVTVFVLDLCLCLCLGSSQRVGVEWMRVLRVGRQVLSEEMRRWVDGGVGVGEEHLGELSRVFSDPVGGVRKVGAKEVRLGVATTEWVVDRFDEGILYVFLYERVVREDNSKWRFKERK